MKILIIEDYQNIADLFELYLTKNGHTCTVELSGRTGLQLIKNETWDAIILDLAMPTFSGYDVLDDLDKKGLLKQQKILVCTAAAISNEEINKIKQRNGVKDVMEKPVALSELLQKIEQIHSNS